MATIHSLNKSLHELTDEEFTSKLMEIRANRRKMPEAKVRQKSTSAKSSRAKARKAVRNHDPFALINGMSDDQRAALAKKLMESMK